MTQETIGFRGKEEKEPREQVTSSGKGEAEISKNNEKQFNRSIPGFGRELAEPEITEEKVGDDEMDITDLIPELQPVAEEISDPFREEVNILAEQIERLRKDIKQKATGFISQIINDHHMPESVGDNLTREVIERANRLLRLSDTAKDSFILGTKRLVVQYVNSNMKEELLFKNLERLKNLAMDDLKSISQITEEWGLKILENTPKEKITFPRSKDENQ